MTLLNYPLSRNIKPRSLKLEPLTSPDEAAIYDLIFNDVPLRKVARQIGLSYQGVYIRALAYMRLWNQRGIIAIDPQFVNDLKNKFSDGDPSILTIE